MIINQFFKNLAKNSATLFNTTNVKSKLATAWSVSKAASAPVMKYTSSSSKANWQKFRNTIGKVSPLLNKSGGTDPNKRLTKIAFGLGLGVSLISSRKKFIESVAFKKNDMPASVRFGSGYISWSKKSGMNANHLSTEGLGLSLSSLRHTSTI